MIVFDNSTPTGRDEGPVRTYPKRMGAALHTDRLERHRTEVATGKANAYARKQNRKGYDRLNAA